MVRAIHVEAPHRRRWVKQRDCQRSFVEHGSGGVKDIGYGKISHSTSRCFLSEEDHEWVAHCLEFDLVGAGTDKQSALQLLSDAIFVQATQSAKSRNPKSSVSASRRGDFPKVYRRYRHRRGRTCSRNQVHKQAATGKHTGQSVETKATSAVGKTASIRLISTESLSWRIADSLCGHSEKS